MQQVEVDITPGGHSLEHLYIHRVDRGEPVHEDPVRKIHIYRSGANRLQRAGEQFRRTG